MLEHFRCLSIAKMLERLADFGMAAAKTSLPVLGVPVHSKALNGLDSLLSIAQMPRGIPVGTLAIGPAGAAHPGLPAPAPPSRPHPPNPPSLQHFLHLQKTKMPQAPPPPQT